MVPWSLSLAPCTSALRTTATDGRNDEVLVSIAVLCFLVKDVRHRACLWMIERVCSVTANAMLQFGRAAAAAAPGAATDTGARGGFGLDTVYWRGGLLRCRWFFRRCGFTRSRPWICAMLRVGLPKMMVEWPTGCLPCQMYS